MAPSPPRPTSRLPGLPPTPPASAPLPNSSLPSWPRTNEFNYGLLVSANYINSAGFNPAQAVPVIRLTSTTTIRLASSTLTRNQQNQNIANLLYNPRPPVFIVTNALAVKSNEFRYYLDLNRNGAFEPSGLLGLTNSAACRSGRVS